MYTNFIFDMGNVLMDFSPDYILSRFSDDVVVIELLKKAIFKGDWWWRLDNGDVSFEEALVGVSNDVPEVYHEVLGRFFESWHLHKVPRLDMLEIVRDLKGRGYGIFLCSNAAARFHSYKDTYEVFSYFDDLVISADIGVSKPDPRIYQVVLDRNNLSASSCLFIDDLAVNIAGGEAVGIAGYQYNGNAALLRSFLETLKIL